MASAFNLNTRIALRRRESSGHGHATWVRHQVYPAASASRCGLAFPGPEWTADVPSVQGEVRGCSRCGTKAGQSVATRTVLVFASEEHELKTVEQENRQKDSTRPSLVVLLSSQRTRLVAEHNAYRIEILTPGRTSIEEAGWVSIVNCVNEDAAYEAYEDIRHGMYVAEHFGDKQ